MGQLGKIALKSILDCCPQLYITVAHSVNKKIRVCCGNSGRNSNRAKNNVFACNLMILFVLGAKNNVFGRTRRLGYKNSGFLAGVSEWPQGLAVEFLPHRKRVRPISVDMFKASW